MSDKGGVKCKAAGGIRVEGNRGMEKRRIKGNCGSRIWEICLRVSDMGDMFTEQGKESG